MDIKEKNKTYIEDNFDLDAFQKETIRQRIARYRKKYQPIINALSYLILILLFILGVLAYNSINYYFDLWQSHQIRKKAQSVTIEPLPSVTLAPETSLPVERGTPALQPVEEAKSLPIREDFIHLRAEFNNDDIIAFLTIEDTNIDYPVVKGPDNEFYLNHDLNKNKNVAGSVFMDFDNHVDVFGYNTVLYGHNMKNKSMFHNLRYYSNEDFYQKHKYISLKTLYEDTTWEIFSCYRTDTNFNYIQTTFPNAEAFQTLKASILEKSLYNTGVEILPDDIILTLSTCTNDLDDTRLAVHGKLISQP